MECESIPEKMRKIILSAEEYQARLATALQTPGKMQIVMYENEQGQLQFPAPSPVLQMGNMDLAGRIRPNVTNAAGAITEASAAGISALVSQLRDLQRGMVGNDPWQWTAGGVRIEDARAVNIIPFAPVTVTADGAGNPPATAIIPLVAALNLDVMLWMVPDDDSGAGQYIHRFRTDPLAAVGGISAVDPAWAAVVIPAVAGIVSPPNTWGHRIMTDTVASAFGIADGVNGDWPNAASVTYYGFYRTVA